jgi:tetratricopeptide (TPR) repeat protein
MWNLAREPAHLETAAEQAKRVLALDLPPGADVAARFCLAKQALRDRRADPEKRLAEFIEKTRGDRVPASALAAATVLALQANARTVYQDYRQQLLQCDGEAKPNLQPVYAFLQDKHHQYRNFWATPGGNGYERPQKYLFRDMVSGLSEPPDHKHRPQFELIGLDGQAIGIPQVAAGKMLGLVFIEPPAYEDAAKQLMDRTSDFVKTYTDRGVDVVVAVIADDANTVRSLLDQRDIGCRVGRVTDGLDSPLVQTLGILSADRVPNLFLLRPDGSIAWSISGLRYHTFGNLEYALSLGIESNIEKVRSDAAFETLENREYDSALKLFAERLPPKKKLDWWAADRFQGRALAYIGLGDWSAALTEIDAAIDQRKSDFKGGICKCHGLVEMYLTKAMILDKLGRAPKPTRSGNARRVSVRLTRSCRPASRVRACPSACTTIG